MQTIIAGGVSQEKLIEAPRKNVERLARWLNKNGANILIDPKDDQKALVSRIWWGAIDTKPWQNAGMY